MWKHITSWGVDSDFYRQFFLGFATVTNITDHVFFFSVMQYANDV